MERKPPTIEEIKSKLSAWEDFYGTLHQNQMDMDEFYELTFSADVPSRYPTRKSSTPRDWIDVGVRHFTLDNPTCLFPIRRDSDEARARSAMLDKAGTFWLDKDTEAIKDAAKKVLLRGECFLKLNMDDTYFGGYEDMPVNELTAEELVEYREKRLYHFPLYITVPDPINVYCSTAHDGLVPLEVIESFEMTIAEAEALCERNNWKGWSADGRKPSAKVKWISYYSRYWRCFILEDVAVLSPEVQPNIFGFVPYVHFSAQAGQSGYDGAPEKKYRAIIHGKQDEFKMESRLLSQIDAINTRYSWLRYIFRGNPDVIKKYYPNGVPTDPDELLFEIPEQMELKVMEGEEPPDGLFNQLGLLTQRAAPPAVMSGVRPTGVYSGQYFESLVATAKPQYKDAFKNLEKGLATLVGLGLRLLEKVYRHDIMIMDLGSFDSKAYTMLKVSDIKGNYDCKVKLLAEPPEATDTRKALGATLWQKQAISKHKMQVDYFDMTEEEAADDAAQHRAEVAMDEPLVRAAMSRDAMEMLGMEKALKAIEESDRQTAMMGKQPFLGVGSTPPNMTGTGMGSAKDMVDMRGRNTGMDNVPSPRAQYG